MFVAIPPSEHNIDSEHTEFKDLESHKNGAFHENHDQYAEDSEPMVYNMGLSAKNVVVCWPRQIYNEAIGQLVTRLNRATRTRIQRSVRY